MVNEMWVHEDVLGHVFQIEATLLEGNSGNRVRHDHRYDDIWSVTPQGPQKYRVMTNDLKVLIENWKTTTKSIKNPCADLDHKDQGPQNYRVMTNDPGVLIKNWKGTDRSLPGDCPRP